MLSSSSEFQVEYCPFVRHSGSAHKDVPGISTRPGELFLPRPQPKKPGLPMKTRQVGCAGQVGRGVILIGSLRHAGKSMTTELFHFPLRVRPDRDKIKESGEHRQIIAPNKKLFRYKYVLLRTGSPLPRRPIPDNFLANISGFIERRLLLSLLI